MAATYALVPTTLLADARGGLIGMEGLFAWCGTLSASGTYTTGGDTFPTGGNPEDKLRVLGAGKVVGIEVNGASAQWDAVNKKLKLFTGTIPMAEIASGAALATLNGAQVIIWGR